MHKHLIVLFIFFQLINSGSILAQKKSSGEAGIGLGASSYFGDLNKVPYSNPHFAANLFYRHTFDVRLAVKGIFQYAFLSASGTHFQGEVPETPLNDRIYDIAILGEFNFMRFLPKNRKYVYTPYITAGVGCLLNNYYFNIPFGAGLKYNLKNGFIVGGEVLMKKMFTDNLDYLPQVGMGGHQTSYAGNTDWYSVFSVNLAYKINYAEKCPAIN
jgi:hypothetical protein